MPESSFAALAIAAINATKEIVIAWLRRADGSAKTASGSRPANDPPPERH